MRRGELAGLKWSDLDRSRKRLSIIRTMQSVAGQPVEFDVKTCASLPIVAGVPIKVLSERLAHAHPAFTMHPASTSSRG